MIEPELRLARLQPARLRAELHHRDRARVVDVDRRLHQLVARGGEARPVVLREAARAQPLRLHLRLAAHQPLRHLGLRHLEREERDRRLVTDAEIRGGAERERGLPHRRAGREDDQVAGLEAGRELVELAEARGDAGDVDAGLVEVHDPREALLEQVVDVGEVAADPLLGELEHHLLGAVDEVRRLAGTCLAEPLDLLADPNEPAERRHLLDDAGVVLGVRGRRHDRRQLRDLGGAADPLELAALVELVREGDRVDRLALAVEGERGPEDRGRATRGRSHAASRTSVTAPIAVAESSIAPRTDSSASRFCGGTSAVGRLGATVTGALNLSAKGLGKNGENEPPSRGKRTCVPILSPAPDGFSPATCPVVHRPISAASGKFLRSPQALWMNAPGGERADAAACLPSGRTPRGRGLAAYACCSSASAAADSTTASSSSGSSSTSPRPSASASASRLGGLGLVGLDRLFGRRGLRPGGCGGLGLRGCRPPPPRPPSPRAPPRAAARRPRARPSASAPR